LDLCLRQPRNGRAHRRSRRLHLLWNAAGAGVRGGGRCRRSCAHPVADAASRFRGERLRLFR
jgi:hypothetical protein